MLAQSSALRGAMTSPSSGRNDGVGLDLDEPIRIDEAGDLEDARSPGGCRRTTRHALCPPPPNGRCPRDRSACAPHPRGSAPASCNALPMMSRMARVCCRGIANADMLPLEPAVVPPTATILPTRTAREKPMIGSYGLPEETLTRAATGFAECSFMLPCSTNLAVWPMVPPPPRWRGRRGRVSPHRTDARSAEARAASLPTTTPPAQTCQAAQPCSPSP